MATAISIGLTLAVLAVCAAVVAGCFWLSVFLVSSARRLISRPSIPPEVNSAPGLTK